MKKSTIRPIAWNHTISKMQHHNQYSSLANDKADFTIQKPV